MNSMLIFLLISSLLISTQASMSYAQPSSLLYEKKESLDFLYVRNLNTDISYTFVPSKNTNDRYFILRAIDNEHDGKVIPVKFIIPQDMSGQLVLRPIGDDIYKIFSRNGSSSIPALIKMSQCQNSNSKYTTYQGICIYEESSDTVEFLAVTDPVQIVVAVAAVAALCVTELALSAVTNKCEEECNTQCSPSGYKDCNASIEVNLSWDISRLCTIRCVPTCNN